MPASEQEWQDFRDRAARAASKGAALLDRVQPEWFRKIDTAHLEMWHCKRCICGQLFGEFDWGIGHFGFSDAESDNHGFDMRVTDSEYFGYSAWMELGRAWRMEIQKREKGHV